MRCILSAVVLTAAVSLAGCGGTDLAATSGQPSSPTSSESAGATTGQTEGTAAEDEQFKEACLGLKAALSASAGDFIKDPGRSQVRPISDLVKADPSAEALVGVVKDMQDLGTWLKGKFDYDVAELVTVYLAQGMDAGKALKEATKMAQPLLEAPLSQHVEIVSAIHGPPPVSLTSVNTDLEIACP